MDILIEDNELYSRWGHEFPVTIMKMSINRLHIEE